MGHILTNRHASLFLKIGTKNLLSFLQDIYKSQKLTELTSFAIWELLHQLRLFPKKSYLQFDNGKVLRLDNGKLPDPNFRTRVKQFFNHKDLHVENSAHNWKLLYINENEEIFGCLYPDDRDLYKSSDNGKSIVLIKKFPKQIKSIFISSQNTIFVCVKGSVYKSTDNGDSFKKSLDLGSEESFFRYNNGMTETPDKTLIIAEYGNIWEKRGWRKLAYLYFSSNDGKSWEKSDFLIKKGTNKHVHLVKYSRLFKKIFMADGDNYKKLWVNDSLCSSHMQSPHAWKPVNKFHIQKGGYTSVIESDDKILFGTDYQGGTNFIVETSDGRKFTNKIIPDPYRRSPIINMVQRKSIKGNEIWAVLPYSTANTNCLLMYTKDGGEKWKKVIEYNKSTHHVSLISSSNEMADVLYFSVENYKKTDRVVYKITDNL